MVDPALGSDIHHLAGGSTPPVDGVSALMEAVSTRHNDLIDPLISYHADPAMKDARGRTAADIAKQKGNDEAGASLAHR